MPAWTCPLSHCCFFFTSISGAVVFPKGLAGAAVIGAFVLLQVTVPWPVTRTFLLYVHRIYNELIKCTCNTSFAACYFETELCQYCLVIGTWPLLLFPVLTGSLKYNPKCVKWLCVCVYILQGNDAFHSERFTHMMPSCPLRQLLWKFAKICWEAQVTKWLKLKMTATNVASVWRQDKNS